MKLGQVGITEIMACFPLDNAALGRWGGATLVSRGAHGTPCWDKADGKVTAAAISTGQKDSGENKDLLNRSHAAT